MESPIGGVCILMRAPRAHRKFVHAGVDPVIRGSFNSSKAWSAVGARDEEIVVASILLVLHLEGAWLADSYVSRDDGSL